MKLDTFHHVTISKQPPCLLLNHLVRVTQRSVHPAESTCLTIICLDTVDVLLLVFTALRVDRKLEIFCCFLLFGRMSAGTLSSCSQTMCVIVKF